MLVINTRTSLRALCCFSDMQEPNVASGGLTNPKQAYPTEHHLLHDLAQTLAVDHNLHRCKLAYQLLSDLLAAQEHPRQGIKRQCQLLVLVLNRHKTASLAGIEFV